MAITTNDAIVKYGTTRTLEANGASTANTVITQADDADYSLVTHGNNAPDAEFVASFTFSVAPTENSTIDLYARELNIDGTGDVDVPEASAFRPKYIGSFVVNNVTTLQYGKILAYDVPTEASYYIYNNTTGQTISAGWTLKVTPRTVGPA
jgi:hypothetical protein